jgi:hypothetical protein
MAGGCVRVPYEIKGAGNRTKSKHVLPWVPADKMPALNDCFRRIHHKMQDFALYPQNFCAKMKKESIALSHQGIPFQVHRFM